jgi:hypothetical protein
MGNDVIIFIKNMKHIRFFHKDFIKNSWHNPAYYKIVFFIFCPCILNH